MIREAGNQLAEYALNELGDEVRTVAVLYEDDCEVVYLRDDLRESYEPEDYKEVADSFRIEMRGEQHLKKESPIGPKRSIIHYHDNAFVFQFPHDDCHSIILSVAPSVGSDLRSFINACGERI